MLAVDTRGGGRRTERGYVFELTGGCLALDLANTVDERGTDTPRELLTSWPDLIDWSAQTGAVEPAEAARLRRQGAAMPAEAEETLRRVRRVREALFDLFLVLASGARPTAPALGMFNEALGDVLPRLRVGETGAGFAWHWSHPPGALDTMVPPVLLAAADLLRDADRLARLRVCEAAHRCRWLFLDHSRNGTRRWCDMRVCGNRAKARRHRARPDGGRR